MKINKICVIITIVMATLLMGCIGKNHYNNSQKKEIINKGRPMLEAYISTLPAESVTLGACDMALGIIEGGLIYTGIYPSRAVTMDFVADGQNYKALVNTEDGKIWSNYYMFDLNEQIKRQLLPYCERYGFEGDFEVTGASTFCVLHYKDVETNSPAGELMNTYVLIEDLISGDLNDEDVLKRADKFLVNAPLDAFSITYDSTDGAYFDPRIITDYLAESGNYKIEETTSRGRNEYKINGETVEIKLDGDN